MLTLEAVDVEGFIDRKKLKSLVLNVGGYEFHVARHFRCSIGMFCIKSESVLVPWDEWVSETARNLSVYRAWLVDAEYDFWQNAAYTSQYEAHGRSYAHLRLGHYCSLYEGFMIDIDNNPGRWFFDLGYIEAVGSPMWLGERFWTETGARKSDVLNLSGISAREDPSGFLRIEASDKPFSTDQGESGELQNALRKALYPRAGRVT